jgi:hypothetical protein
VRVETRWQGVGGVGGLFERLFAPRVLRRLYAEELERLDRYARTVPPRCQNPSPATTHHQGVRYIRREPFWCSGAGCSRPHRGRERDRFARSAAEQICTGV